MIRPTTRFFSVVALFGCLFTEPPSAHATVDIEWVTVGSPGNTADTTIRIDHTTGYGSIPYVYNMGKYDVTVSQYVEFLNIKDPTGDSPLGLYNSNMSNPTWGGVNYDPSATDGFKYSIISGRGNHPMNYESWFDAVRFANWMNNGQGSGDTENGSYSLLGGTPTPTNWQTVTRNPGIGIFLPTENEWYKAAYYNPVNGMYFKYSTGSNTQPTPSTPTSLPNHANYANTVHNLTDVGAYSGTTSAFGNYDMTGDVFQWTETLIEGSLRAPVGGAWNFEIWSSFSRGNHGPTDDFSSWFGFRLVSVPEPSTLILAALGGLALLAMRRHAVR